MERRVKGIKIAAGIIFAALLVNGCSTAGEHTESYNTVSDTQVPAEEEAAVPEEAAAPFSFINAAGRNLQGRIRVPQGYHRVKRQKGSLTAFLRKYPLKKDGSPVLLYDGTEKGDQNAHAAVFKLPIGAEDLQQCADSVMRVYAEYYYKNKKYSKIRFSLGGGFSADFGKWSRGNGIGLRGDSLYWFSQPENDRSYASLKKFLRMVFAYSGTMNLEEGSKKINVTDIDVGDCFIKGGSPGHVVMVVDLCKDEKGGKAFLLAQGYMPAQEFHVLKNPLHEEDPWYYQEEISYPFETPEYTFEKGSLRRLDL